MDPLITHTHVPIVLFDTIFAIKHLQVAKSSTGICQRAMRAFSDLTIWPKQLPWCRVKLDFTNSTGCLLTVPFIFENEPVGNPQNWLLCTHHGWSQRCLHREDLCGEVVWWTVVMACVGKRHSTGGELWMANLCTGIFWQPQAAQTHCMNSDLVFCRSM